MGVHLTYLKELTKVFICERGLIFLSKRKIYTGFSQINSGHKTAAGNFDKI